MAIGTAKVEVRRLKNRSRLVGKGVPEVTVMVCTRTQQLIFINPCVAAD